MTEDQIDWSKTTFEGSRREQLKRWRALSLRQRLEALDRLSEQAGRPLVAMAGSRSQVQQPTASYAGCNEIVLPGCTPTPLASYLKALAVLRLVAEQGGDPDATGCWRNDEFVIRTRLSCETLETFFLEKYSPSPLVAPWGARSGFYAGSSEKSAREALDQIVSSSLPRLAMYREAIKHVRALLAKHGFDEKATDERKLELLAICRAELPDDIMGWLDACYTLTSDGRAFPPLLGTGGNEGSGSYVSGFARLVIGCVIERNYDAALGSALFGRTQAAVYCDQTPGHFSPSDAGGGNTTFDADARMNPWNYLFCLEGTLLFAGNATRRLEQSGFANFPFVVAPSAAHGGGFVPSEERPKQAKRQVFELWLPLWQRYMSIDEIKVLLSEGRATLGRKTAKNGLDFARGIAALGVDRGIDEFQRYAFLMRNGQSFFAAPLERLKVRRNADADLIGELERDDWLGSIQRYARRDEAPNAFKAAVARMDAALFAMTQRADRHVVQAVLRALGQVEALGSTSSKVREAVRPMPALSIAWAQKANDASAEFRIAASLAALRMQTAHGAVLTLRPHLCPVSLDGRQWEPTSKYACWGPGRLERNLAAVLHRRRLEASNSASEAQLLASDAGATLSDVAAFLSGETDDGLITELAVGLSSAEFVGLVPTKDQSEITVPFPYLMLKPFFTPVSMLRSLEWLREDRSLPLQAEIPARLGGDDVASALRLAWRRLRAVGAKLPGSHPPDAIGLTGSRLLAALMIPLTYAETGKLLRRLAITPDRSSETEPVTSQD